jgi:peroxiredoxin
MKTLIFIIILFITFMTYKITAQNNPLEIKKDSIIKIENQANDYELSTILKTGSLVPDFTIKTIDGIEFKLSELKGKTVFINFFTLSCPSCMKELPVFEKEIWQKYKDNKNVVILIVGREETVDKLKAFRDEKQFTFPLASDPKREVYALFAIQYVPRNIIIDKEGKLVMTEVGFTEEKSAELLQKIQELLIND